MTGQEAVYSLLLGTASSLLATLMVAIIAYIFRARIKSFFHGMTLQAPSNTPAISLEIDSVKNENDEWTTLFLIENIGNIDITKIRIYLCSRNFPSNRLSIRRIRIESERKWVNNGGHRIQISTRSLHDGCNLTEDQRYFVEFIDNNSGVIYRAARGGPSAKDGSMSIYGTIVCKKRLPSHGLAATSGKKIAKVSNKYDIDLALG